MFASGLFLDSPLVRTFLHIFLKKNCLGPLLSFSVLKDGHFALYDEFNSFDFFYSKESTSPKDGHHALSTKNEISLSFKTGKESSWNVSVANISWNSSVLFNNLIQVWLYTGISSSFINANKFVNCPTETPFHVFGYS